MTKISCYKTTQEKLPKAFCLLAEKFYHNNITVFVYTNSREYTIELDKALWTYSKKQFIPHGTIYDPYPEKQPVLLGSELKNLNNSSSMIIINANENEIASILTSFERLNVDKCGRLTFLYDQREMISDQAIKNTISKSSLGDFKYESYVQTPNNSWQIQDDIAN